jgi:hypothetical protein
VESKQTQVPQQLLTMAENPTREGVGAFGLLMTGLPAGILLDDGDAMQLETAEPAGGCCGDRSKSCAEDQRKSFAALVRRNRYAPRPMPRWRLPDCICFQIQADWGYRAVARRTRDILTLIP